MMTPERDEADEQPWPTADPIRVAVCGIDLRRDGGDAGLSGACGSGD
jgi:hypothetical protein